MTWMQPVTRGKAGRSALIGVSSDSCTSHWVLWSQNCNAVHHAVVMS